MKLLPHQVLKKLAESARERAQYELAGIGRHRRALRDQRDQATAHILQIRQQREQAIRMTVQAGMLLMYDELIREQQMLIGRLDEAIEQVHKQEQALLRRWLEQDQRSKAFGRLDRKFIAEANRALDRRLQQFDDDRVASRMAGQAAAEA